LQRVLASQLAVEIVPDDLVDPSLERHVRSINISCSPGSNVFVLTVCAGP
jgi:hypothetical protein